MFKPKSLISLFSEAGQSIFILFCSSPSGRSGFDEINEFDMEIFETSTLGIR
jgi:hypothetical protein